MPRQKLTWRQPKRLGQAGQVQPKGPHDPEHQEAPVRSENKSENERMPRKKAAAPRLASKQKAL